jgi:hypothetical protein
MVTLKLPIRLILPALMLSFTWLAGCATETSHRSAVPVPARVHGQPPPSPQYAPASPSDTLDSGWSERVVTEEELYGLSDLDPELTPLRVKEILARMNGKGGYLISEDINRGRKLRAPNDFRAFKNWSPMPKSVPAFRSQPKTVLILRDLPFIGWYERGNLTGDSHICIGRRGEETEAGSYRVEEQDIDHYSHSYRNAFNEPAWMPYALRIYGHVWIHAGDIAGPFCSPGCVILPLNKAEQLFDWADLGTPVLVVDSERQLSSTMKSTHGAPLR